jgi:hypothetical protein
VPSGTQDNRTKSKDTSAEPFLSNTFDRGATKEINMARGHKKNNSVTFDLYRANATSGGNKVIMQKAPNHAVYQSVGSAEGSKV